MIKGDRHDAEAAIADYLRQNPDFRGEVRTSPSPIAGPDEEVEQGLTTLGCGWIGARPSFILGLCRPSRDQAAVLISENYKPRSLMTAFCQIVIRLFPEIGPGRQLELTAAFGSAYRDLAERILFAENAGAALERDALGVFGDIGWIEEKLGAASRRSGHSG